MPHTKSMDRSANGNGNGTIRKKTVTKNGKEYTFWEARATIGYDPGTGKQIQKSITGKTQKEVRQKLSKIITELDEGTYKASSKLTVKEWLETWLTDYQGNVKPSTALLYRQHAEMYIIPRLGSLKLEALKSDDIQKFCNELFRFKEDGGRGLSTKTVKNVHGVFHKALEQAKKNQVLRFNPSDACELPRIYKAEVKPLNREQAAFLREIQDHTHEYLFKIALFTGMRQGELLGLSWDSLDPDHGTLTVKCQLCREKKMAGKYYFSPPKNNKSRVLTLAPSVVRLFRWQKLKQNGDRLKAGEAWEETGLVFTNPTKGYLSYRTVYDCFKRVLKKLELPDVRFHDLRHTYAVFALQSGDDIKTVQENLGHATAAFTLDIYGHVLDEMKQASASRMEKLIQGFASGQTDSGFAVSNA